MTFKPFVLQGRFIVNSAQFLCFFYPSNVFTKALKDHSIRFTLHFPQAFSAPASQAMVHPAHHWAFQETISKRNWNTKNYWEILFFITLKCTLKLLFLFLSPPSPTTAQTGKYENQPFKYEPFSSDTSKQVFSFMDANLQESFPSSTQRTQDQDLCNVHISPDVTKPQWRETMSLKIPLQGLQAVP